jgi:hypothetical protein
MHTTMLTPQLSLSWFLSVRWERTKRVIPSRRFQLKSNDTVIVCWLTIAKRTHLSAQNFSLWQSRRARARGKTKDGLLASFQSFEFLHSGETTMTESWDEMVMWLVALIDWWWREVNRRWGVTVTLRSLMGWGWWVGRVVRGGRTNKEKEREKRRPRPREFSLFQIEF